MKDHGWTIALVVAAAALFVFISWQVVGPSGRGADADACDFYWDLGTPLYAMDMVSLDEGMKAWGKRAQRAARLADDGDLKAALIHFSEVARSKTWDDAEAETVHDRAFAVLAFCPN